MKKFYVLCVLVVMALAPHHVKGQDPQFSQFFAAPLYLNPSFAGSTPQHRFIGNYRNQWPSIPNAFATYAFSYDLNLSRLNSGIGFMAMTDKAGSANLRSTTLNFIYSYKINIADKWVIAPSLQFGYGGRSLEYGNLIFGDQIEFGNSGVPSSDPAMHSLGNIHFFDIGSGLLVHNEHAWFGVSAFHMNEPNHSLLGEVSILPMKKSVHGGVKIPLYNGPKKLEYVASVAPSFVYKSQGEFNQLDLGTHFYYGPVMLGAWYRGIPVKKEMDRGWSRDAVTFLLGLRVKDFDFGYSYDITVNRLSTQAGGAHEFSIAYQFNLKGSKPKKKEKFIPCPTFR
jgi:type IX secretion system PorP/SprF family membrane protein